MLLDYRTCCELLGGYHIKIPRYKIIKNIGQASSLLKNTKSQFVLKASARDLIHKTEAGAVFTDIKSIGELKASYKKLISNTKKFSPEIIIQEQINGHQVIIGAKRDKEFGIVILFGLGGIFVEILKDISIEIAPISKKTAYNMIKRTKAYDILAGKRTNQRSDIDDLANLIVNITRLMQQKKTVREIDLNPVIVNKKGAYAVDPKIMI